MKMCWAERAERVLRELIAYGVRCHPECRICRMVSAMTTGRVLEPGDPMWQVAIEGIRDLQMIEFSFQPLRNVIPVEVLAPRLRRLVKGSVLPGQDIGSDSFGSDVQSELFIAAVCARAGMLPSLDEPDVVCQAGKHIFGIAVKRPKSMRTFEDNFRSAANQVEKSKLTGIIAMDMSLASNPDNRPIIGSFSKEEIWRAKRLRILAFLDEWSQKMKDWARGREIRSVLFTEHIPLGHEDGGWSLGTLTDAIDLSPHNQRRHREYNIFWKSWRKGLPLA